MEGRGGGWGWGVVGGKELSVERRECSYISLIIFTKSVINLFISLLVIDEFRI